MDICEDEVVARIDPVAHGLIDLTNILRVQHSSNALESKIRARGCRVLKCERLRTVGALSDYWAVAGGYDRDADIVRASDRDGLLTHVGRVPVPLELVLGAMFAPSEILNVEVLVVSSSVCDAPCDLLVVSEVRESGTSWERHPDYVKFRTGYVILVVDIWSVQAAVWVRRRRGAFPTRCESREPPSCWSRCRRP